MFSFIKSTLQSIYSRYASRFKALFSKKVVDAALLTDLEEILISSDAGAKTTKMILQELKTSPGIETADGAWLQNQLYLQLTALLSLPKPSLNTPVILLVGINGSGKTSLAGKLAHAAQAKGKRVLLVAADTFRAAACAQLAHIAEQIGCAIVQGKEGQDPASVVFGGCQKFKEEKFDQIIIDTAGRLQTKTNLMQELSKIRRIIEKQLPSTVITTYLTIDAILGQNSFEQATLFKECADVNGIVLTKMDSSSKGGIVFAIAKELSIPVVYMSYGEKLENLRVFDPHQYVHDLLGM